MNFEAVLEPVLDTLKYLKDETGVWFELTELLIPGENDSETEIEEMTQWVLKHLGPDWYVLSTWNLDIHDQQAACHSCGSHVACVFEEQPGIWGARRQYVHIASV